MTKKISRREFLIASSISLTGSVLAGCSEAPRWVVLAPYVNPPEQQITGDATWYASTCRQCPAGCGIIVRIMNGRALKIEGNPEHPLNRGKLCARGQAGLQVLYNPDRLSSPLQQESRGGDQFQSVDWDQALKSLATHVQQSQGKLAVWLGSTVSGHLYELFRMFTSALNALDPIVYDLYTQVCGYSLLRESSIELSGFDGLPSYLSSTADVLFSFGADFLGTWLSSVRYGVDYGDFRDLPTKPRGFLVQFEPRMSQTAAVADDWIPIRPGSEGILAQSLLWLIANRGFGSQDRRALARTMAGDLDIQKAAEECDVPISKLEKLAEVFATSQKSLAIPGSNLTGQTNAAQSVAAIQALNMLTSSDDGAATMTFTDDSVTAPMIKPKVSAYSEVQRLIQSMQAGEIETLIICDANPVYDLPPKSGFVDALQKVPFIVSMNSMKDETGLQSNLILPARTYLESWGYEVVSPNFGTPMVGSQQPVIRPFNDARSAGDVVLAIAKEIPSVSDIMKWADEVDFLSQEVAQLPPGKLVRGGQDERWAAFLQHGGWWLDAAEAKSPESSSVQNPIQVPPPVMQGSEQDYPYYLVPYLSELLSDGRGANQTWLQGGPDPMTTISWETWVEVNLETAAKLGIRDGDIVQVITPNGQIEAPAYTFPALRPDTIAVPFGQGHQAYGRYASQRGANPIVLTGSQTDNTQNSLLWSAQRAKIIPTGKHSTLANFENKEGTLEGFPNMDTPG
jgi:anaerobic selenocysteine-containing dehydrogenase